MGLHSSSRQGSTPYANRDFQKIRFRHLTAKQLEEYILYMPRKPSSQPNEVEMQILAALWELGPSTVRQIHDALAEERDTAYASTVKMVSVMTEKGLLLKDDTQRPQVFRPAKSKEKMQARLVRDLVKRAFGGAVTKLVQSAVESEKISAKDLEEMKRILREAESAGEDGQ
jgi:BlaI family transcriptional regulator, penicillinase repressor